jgi:hypothetical protein
MHVHKAFRAGFAVIVLGAIFVLAMAHVAVSDPASAYSSLADLKRRYYIPQRPPKRVWRERHEYRVVRFASRPRPIFCISL